MATWKLSIIIFIIACVVFAGAFVTLITSVPELLDRGMQLIPWAVAAGFAVAAAFSVIVAGRLNRARGASRA